MKLNEVTRGSLSLDPVEITMKKLQELGAIEWDGTKTDDNGDEYEEYTVLESHIVIHHSIGKIATFCNYENSNLWAANTEGGLEANLTKKNISLLYLYKIDPIPLPTNKKITESNRGSLILDPVERAMTYMLNRKIIYRVENDEYNDSEIYNCVDEYRLEYGGVPVDHLIKARNGRWFVERIIGGRGNDSGWLGKSTISNLKLYKITQVDIL